MASLMADDPKAAAVPALCSDLLRFDSSNFGTGEGPGERPCAEWVAARLSDAGFDPVFLESAPGRANVIVRLPGTDPNADGLVVHGHLDVVPAQASDWSVHPFSGEERDGLLWGRGAVDMKGMNAMMLGLLLDAGRTGARPPRDTVFAFFADEEAGGTFGAGWLVDHHPELFEGCTRAISEVGGFSQVINDKRFYLLQTAEKGMLWLRLIAHGRAGHGSQVGTDNAVTRLAAAVTRIGEHEWPIEITPTVRQFLDVVSEVAGVDIDVHDYAQMTRVLGTTARWVGATVQNTSNPTLLDAGYKHNVIPTNATALVDCRFLPGHRDQLLAEIQRLAGERVDVEIVHEDIALETDLHQPFGDAMVRALMAEDPDAVVSPYCLSGGTDNKSLARLGIEGFGFAPLKLPPDLDFASMFHGVDERVPSESLVFGRRVLERLVFAETW